MVAKNRLQVPEDSPPSATGIEEVSLLLPSWQVSALAEAAQSLGMTMGQLVRCILTRTLGPRPPRNC